MSETILIGRGSTIIEKPRSESEEELRSAPEGIRTCHLRAIDDLLDRSIPIRKRWLTPTNNHLVHHVFTAVRLNPNGLPVMRLR